MRKIVISLVLVFALIFSIFLVNLGSATVMLPPFEKYCAEGVSSLNLTNQTLKQEYNDRCWDAFLGPSRNLSTCEDIPKEFSNYNAALGFCYALKASDTNSCGNLTVQDQKDQCYNLDWKCDQINNQTLKQECEKKLEYKKSKAMKEDVKNGVTLAVIFLFPIIMLIMIIKTIIDYRKDRKIRWWLRILIFIVLLIAFLLVFGSVLFRPVY